MKILSRYVSLVENCRSNWRDVEALSPVESLKRLRTRLLIFSRRRLVSRQRRRLTRKGWWISSTSIPQHVHTRVSLNHPWPVSTAKLWRATHHTFHNLAHLPAYMQAQWIFGGACRLWLVPRATYLTRRKPRVTRSTFDPIEILPPRRKRAVPCRGKVKAPSPWNDR